MRVFYLCVKAKNGIRISSISDDTRYFEFQILRLRSFLATTCQCRTRSRNPLPMKKEEATIIIKLLNGPPGSKSPSDVSLLLFGIRIFIENIPNAFEMSKKEYEPKE